MRTRAYHIWNKLTSSYWFVPTLMLVGAALLAVAMLALDDNAFQTPDSRKWLYAGGADGARTLLSVIAGSIVTVAGVVFSITVVALTQASSQFGPRLLRNFMRDTVNQLVLGTFVATFLYCVLVLRTIQSGDHNSIPHLSVTVAVALAVASLLVLIYFIHHVSSSLQAPQVVTRVWDELRETLARMYPERLGRDGQSPHQPGHAQQPPDPFGEGGGAVCGRESGYLQAIDAESLMSIAVANDLRLKIVCRPGDFVYKGSALLFVWPANAVTAELRNELDRAFLTGRNRTPEQDVEYALDQMVEIAVRALSPGINDPFTACTCIDWLGESLSRIAAADAPSPYRYDDRGAVRIVTRVSSFRGMVDTAFNQIRQYGRRSAAVTIRLLETISTIAEHLNHDEQRAALRRQAEIIFRQSREALPEEQDRADVQQRYGRAMAALGALPAGE